MNLLRVFTIVFAITSGACSPRPESITIRMAVGGQNQFIYLPLTLADRLGYFKDERVSVTVSDVRGGSEALAALLGGSVDMVTGFYEHNDPRTSSRQAPRDGGPLRSLSWSGANVGQEAL